MRELPILFGVLCQLLVTTLVAAAPPTASRSSLPPDPTDDNPPEIPQADRDMEPEEAVRSALEIFGRIDRGEVDEIPPSFIENLNRYVVVLQAKAPKNPWRAYVAGRTFALLGRGGEAIDQLKRFAETREGRNEWQAFRVLGDLMVQEFPRLAKSNYDKAQTLKAGEPAVLYGLSFCAFQTGDLSEATRFAQEAVDADQRRDARFSAHLAKVLLQGGRREEAERAAGSALDISLQRARVNPRSVKPLLVVDQQYQLLIEVLRAKLAFPAGVVGLTEDSLRLASIVRERAGVTDKLAWYDALHVLENAVQRVAAQAPVALQEQYAVALAQVGRSAEAISAFEKVLVAQPENPTAKQWMERLKP